MKTKTKQLKQFGGCTDAGYGWCPSGRHVWMDKWGAVYGGALGTLALDETDAVRAAITVAVWS